MPYISEEAREWFEIEIFHTPGAPRIKGELAFIVARAVDQFMEEVGDTNYQNLSDAIAALEDVAHEIRRRFLDPYEDVKRKENGEVFTWLTSKI